MALERDPWWERAACKDADPDIFLPLNLRSTGYRPRGRAGNLPDEIVYAEAAEYCRTCPVRVSCLNDALQSDGELVAYQGGFSPAKLHGYRGSWRYA